MNSSLAKLGLLLFFLAGCASAPVSTARLKLLVSADGLYRVSAAELQRAGLPRDGVDPATLQLFLGDREIALRTLGDAKDFSIEFYGQASDSPYSAFNAYWLRWGAANGKRMREISAPPATDPPQRSFQETVRVTQPTLYIAQAGGYWFWHALTAPTTTTIALTLPAALAAPARVQLNLWGSTQDAAAPDHHLRVFFNDARVADETWDGQGAHPIAANIPANAIRAGENTLRLVAPGDTRAKADVVLLSSVEIAYTRQLVAQKESIRFDGATGSYRVEGFSGGAPDLFDITDPGEPSRVSNAAFASGALTFRADAPRRWLAIGANARQSPARIAPMMTLPSTANADYVIITHPDFVDVLEPLVKWRAQRGLKPVVVTTTAIYDAFGYGAESPLALRAFLDSLQPKPRFVLLVGKASYDFRDYLNAPNKNLTPTFLVNTPHLNQVASDNWFAAASAADARPVFALGRIPAKTKEQVARVVNKIIAFESGQRNADWRNRALFIADDKEPTFAAMADASAQTLPPPITAQKIYLAARQGDVNATRAEIVARWNAGAQWITYIGHGSLDTWAEGPLFSVANLGEIKNAERLPILFTPTCLDGFFYHPQKDSLAEELLFKNDGGIVAGIVPTGLSLPPDQQMLMRALFDELFAQRTPTLGEALTRAKQKMDVSAETLREVVETFGLLGDPALEY
ncbi:MAG: C25 family cysteine peptidase [Chloroflexota bacterium]